MFLLLKLYVDSYQFTLTPKISVVITTFANYIEHRSVCIHHVPCFFVDGRGEEEAVADSDASV